MIDFIKVDAVRFVDSDLTAHPLLKDSFETIFYHSTAEIKEQRATYKNMVFVLKPTGRLFIQGSLHKFYNLLDEVYAPNQKTGITKSKGFNGNDFDYNKLSCSIMCLFKMFDVDIEKTRILNIEFGLNIIHTFNTQLILSGLLRHHGMLFNRPMYNSFRKLRHDYYFIKCYDKALQYGMHDNVIRFELKYQKMRELNSVGVFYLVDLMNQSILQNLLPILIKRWGEILFCDYTINPKSLNTKDKLKLANYKNENYWHDLKPNRLHRPKKHLQELISKHSNNIKESLRGQLISKWNTLNAECVITHHSNTLGEYLHKESA